MARPVHWGKLYRRRRHTPLLLNIAQLEKLFFSVFDVLNVDGNIAKTIQLPYGYHGRKSSASKRLFG